MSRTLADAQKIMIKENNYFYNNEILSDFQVRWKATLKEKKSVPTNAVNYIGMPTISTKSNVGKYFVKFASSSSIHGLKHLVAPNRHPAEIFLALLFIIGALLCLIFLSFLFWDRYQNDATVIVLDNDQSKFEVLKAALFICPVPNIELDKIPDVFKKYNIEYTTEAKQFFTFLGDITYENMMETPIYDKVPANKWLEVLYDLRKDIGSNILKENDPYETWVVTERGICLATRSIFAVYATLNYWKTNNWTVVPIPTKLPLYNVTIDGMQENFAVESTALFAACDPLELITYDTPMKMVKPKMLQYATMSMSQIRTETNVKKLRIRQRKCKVFSDGGLETLPVYTKNMCITECRMKTIQERCNCRPHFVRPIEGIDTCNATQLRCIGDIKNSLFLYEYPPQSCECYPKCNIITFQIKDNENADLDDTPINTSVMTLIVKLPQVVYFRIILYDFMDFLTSVGGAAGLFLGASVLSFVEIFYYGTLHLCFYMKRIKQKNKKNKIIGLSK